MSAETSREEISQRIGRLSQLGGIAGFTHADGRGKGTSTYRVRTAAGLEFWVVPDRGMDIFEASFRGRSLCWHSPQGMVHPSYFSNRGLEWLKSFFGGLLTTCGLTWSGAPSVDDGESLGLHGEISNTPAERVSCSEVWSGDDCIFTIQGRVRESSVHGANMVMERSITSSLRSSGLKITDTVTNQGVRTTPLMMLYHFNFGYPLLTERSKIHAPSRKVEPATEWANQSVPTWSSFENPVLNQQERVYFHEMVSSGYEMVSVVLVSEESAPDFGIALSYDKSTLPEFVEWKMTGVNHFVLGLEPANCRTLGRAAERERGTLRMLEPGESESFHLSLDVLDGAAQVTAAIAGVEC